MLGIDYASSDEEEVEAEVTKVAVPAGAEHSDVRVQYQICHEDIGRLLMRLSPEEDHRRPSSWTVACERYVFNISDCYREELQLNLKGTFTATAQSHDDAVTKRHTADGAQIPASELTRPRSGPALDSARLSTPSRDAQALPEDDPRSSPFSNARAAIQSLTMPPMPNFDIPPSPPGSPPAATTKKFDHFLRLKAQGVHFNEKLANSTQLRNPSLFEKLVEFAGMDDRDQYASALSKHLAAPTEFPPWAFADQLNRRQAEIQKRRNEGKKGKSTVEFVSASAGDTGRPASSKLMADRKRQRTKSPER